MSLLLAFTVLATGQASFYAPDLMEQVYANRLAWGHVQPCEQCIGMVALLDADNIGRLVYLDFGDDLGIEGPFLSVDCAEVKHLAGLRQRNRAIEVDWPTAKRHHMAGPVNVRVLWLAPDAACPVQGAC